MGMMRTLFIAAHCDDIELGCGGFVSNTSMKCIHHALVISSVTRSGLDLSSKCVAALMDIGFLEQNILVLDHGVAEFPDREKLWKTINAYAKTVSPDLVFTHDSDGHPHHESVRFESLNQSIPRSTLVSYSSKPYLHTAPRNWYHEILERDVERKLSALQHYDNYAGISYFDHQLLRSWAMVCGNNAGCRYAEAFRIERIQNDPFDIQNNEP